MNCWMFVTFPALLLLREMAVGSLDCVCAHVSVTWWGRNLLIYFMRFIFWEHCLKHMSKLQPENNTKLKLAAMLILPRGFITKYIAKVQPPVFISSILEKQAVPNIKKYKVLFFSLGLFRGFGFKCAAATRTLTISLLWFDLSADQTRRITTRAEWRSFKLVFTTQWNTAWIVVFDTMRQNDNEAEKKVWLF